MKAARTALKSGTRLAMLATCAALCTAIVSAPALAGAAPAEAGAQADEAGDAESGRGPRYSGSLETWLYGTYTQRSDGSLLNPDNRIARLPGAQAVFDARAHLRMEMAPFDVVIDPRLVQEQDWALQGAASGLSGRSGSLRLGQAFLRMKTDSDTLIAGRELFTWGPATFRSPSNPFYFDAGRTNPLAATPGVDLVRLTHGVGSVRLTGAWVFSTSQITPATSQGQTALLKLDQQGGSHLVSLIVAQRQGRAADAPGSDAPFLGAFGQFTPDDAWLVYAEWGSSRQPYALTPGTGSNPLYTVQQNPARTQTGLLGASYTLENGQTLTGEFLHTQGGYTRAGEAQYFSQAAAANVLAQTSPAQGYGALGQALGQAPRLLGRDYVWLGWQSNPQETKLYWRTELSSNLQDGSAQALLYVERNFVPRVTGFMALTRTFGGTSTEYGALARLRLTLGVKLFAF